MRENEVKTKVVVRKLPPLLKEESFLEAVNKKFEGKYDWWSFHGGKVSSRKQVFSRCYLRLKSEQDVVAFSEEFCGHLFVNERGQQFRAEVEYAPFQKVAKATSKKDPRENTIDRDADYLEFLASLERLVEAVPSAEVQLERREAERGVGGKEPVIVTPLMDFVRKKRAAKLALQRGGGRVRVVSNREAKKGGGKGRGEDAKQKAVAASSTPGGGKKKAAAAAALSAATAAAAVALQGSAMTGVATPGATAGEVAAPVEDRGKAGVGRSSEPSQGSQTEGQSQSQAQAKSSNTKILLQRPQASASGKGAAVGEGGGGAEGGGGGIGVGVGGAAKAVDGKSANGGRVSGGGRQVVGPAVSTLLTISKQQQQQQVEALHEKNSSSTAATSSRDGSSEGLLINAIGTAHPTSTANVAAATAELATGPATGPATGRGATRSSHGRGGTRYRDRPDRPVWTPRRRSDQPVAATSAAPSSDGAGSQGVARDSSTETAASASSSTLPASASAGAAALAARGTDGSNSQAAAGSLLRGAAPASSAQGASQNQNPSVTSAGMKRGGAVRVVERGEGRGGRGRGRGRSGHIQSLSQGDQVIGAAGGVAAAGAGDDGASKSAASVPTGQTSHTNGTNQRHASQLPDGARGGSGPSRGRGRGGQKGVWVAVPKSS